MVSGRISTKTGTPPRRTKQSAVETKVYDGMITSSPGWMPVRCDAISSALVQEVVSSTADASVFSFSHSLTFFVNSPSPLILRFVFAAFSRHSISGPAYGGTLKGIMIITSS